MVQSVPARKMIKSKEIENKVECLYSNVNVGVIYIYTYV